MCVYLVPLFEKEWNGLNFNALIALIVCFQSSRLAFNNHAGNKNTHIYIYRQRTHKIGKKYDFKSYNWNYFILFIRANIVWNCCTSNWIIISWFAQDYVSADYNTVLLSA